MSKTPKKQSVLMIRAGAIGDSVAVLPVIRGLRLLYPEGRIELLGYPERLCLGVNPAHADRCSPLSYDEISGLFTEGAGLSRRAASYLGEFGVVLALVHDSDGVIARNLLKLDVGKFAVIPPLPGPGCKKHVTDYLADTLAVSGIAIQPGDPEIPRDGKAASGAESFFRENGLSGSRVLALHPGSGSAGKNWPAAGFAELARMYLAEGGWKVLLVAGPADTAVREYLGRSLGPACARAENLPLKVLAEVLRGCSAFAGNDSGITHMAAAVGIPAAAVFGPTDPAVWGPRGARVAVVRRAAGCSPCLPETRRACGRRRCLEAVSAPDVKQAVDNLMSNII